MSLFGYLLVLLVLVIVVVIALIIVLELLEKGIDLMALRITCISLFITWFLFGGVCSSHWCNLCRIA